MKLDDHALAFERQQNGSFAIVPAGPLRIGTVGRGVGAVDYALPGEAVRLAEKDLLASMIGIAPRNIIMLDQVHEDRIVTIDRPPEENLPWQASADGLVTAERGICLVIRTADCVPVFVHDADRGVLGAAHAGWRGCRLGIAGKLIGQMRERYGARPERMRVYILPSIGPDSYSVQEDVAAFFPKDTRLINETRYVDLWGSIVRSVVSAGVTAKNVLNARRCTLIERDRFYSHRNGDSGRNINYGYML